MRTSVQRALRALRAKTQRALQQRDQARRFRALLKSDSPSLRHIGEAIRKTLDDDLSAQEREWVERIEAVRHETESSVTEITWPDFGAGSPTAGRTADEMRAGVEATANLGDIAAGISKPPFWSQLLFHLVRQTQPLVCVELGIGVGISGSYQAAALHLNERGRLLALDGSPPFAEIASANFQRLGLERVQVILGRFDETLDGALKSAAAVDFAFVDGHHDEVATLRYFDQIYTYLTPGSIVVFDDIDWSPGMKRAWDQIEADRRISASVDCGPMGLCVVSDHSKSAHRLPLVPYDG